MDTTAPPAHRKNPSFDYLQDGNYTVALRVSDTHGCTDSIWQTLALSPPVLDLALSELQLLPDNQTGLLLHYRVDNLGSVPAEELSLEININGSQQLTQLLDTKLLPGEQLQGKLPFALPANQELYACLQLRGRYGAYPDNNPTDNNACIGTQSRFQVHTPYPNPSTDFLRLPVYAPQSEVAAIVIRGNDSRTVYTSSYSLSAGYQILSLPVSSLPSGSYFVEISLPSLSQTFRLVIP
ncbi:MAG: T9SS type A sorting domain-containing protein [Cytophagales bacterium]|nr:T9SS type A sorting domain-containing protein [Cytophagales bacterium]